MGAGSLKNKGFVPRRKAAQVEDFNRHAHTGLQGPINTAAVGNHQDRRLVAGLLLANDPPHANGHDVVGIGFHRFCPLGTLDFGPIQAFVLENHDGVGVRVGGLQQSFEVRPVGGIEHLNAPNRREHRLHA